jgi:hypothetical protein
MPPTLRTVLRLTLSTLYQNALDNSTPEDAANYSFGATLATGTAANLADRVFHDRRTLGTATSENLDLAGSLTDPLGNTVSMAKVKGLLIQNRTATAGAYLLVGGAASNQFPFLNAVGEKCRVGPSGMAFFWNPVDGFTVTAGTGDQLKIDNPGAVASIDYDIFIIGTSA